MKLYRLQVTQNLPIDLDKAWDFLSDPKNLNAITPDNMGFEILSGAEKAMFPGQIIQYKVQPLPGITTCWVTEITHVIEKAYFVDEQRFGPYAFWHHKHFLRTLEGGGVCMEDIIDYKLPLGFLGVLAHRLFIKKRLQAIFGYRREALERLFGTYEA